MNNFDCSTSGVSLDLSCHFDVSMGQINFEENFNRCTDLNGGSLLNNRYLHVDLFIFTGGDNIGGFDLADKDFYHIKKATNKQILKSIIDQFYGEVSEDLKGDCLHYFSKYPYQLNKYELLELVENVYNEDYQQFLINTFDKKFEVIAIRGYCQGGYAEIIFTEELIKEYSFEDREKFLSMMEDHFTNLFYDQPLYCRLEVDAEEYYLDDFQNDQYTWDKSAVLEHASKIIEHDKKVSILEWLAVNLPDQPDTY